MHFTPALTLMILRTESRFKQRPWSWSISRRVHKQTEREIVATLSSGCFLTQIGCNNCRVGCTVAKSGGGRVAEGAKSHKSQRASRERNLVQNGSGQQKSKSLRVGLDQSQPAQSGLQINWEGNAVDTESRHPTEDATPLPREISNNNN